MNIQKEKIFNFPTIVDQAVARLIEKGIELEGQRLDAYFSVGITNNIQGMIDFPRPLLVVAVGRIHMRNDVLWNFKQVTKEFSFVTLDRDQENQRVLFNSSTRQAVITKELFIVFTGMPGIKEAFAARAILMHLVWNNDLVNLDCSKSEDEIKKDFFATFNTEQPDYFDLLENKRKSMSADVATYARELL